MDPALEAPGSTTSAGCKPAKRGTFAEEAPDPPSPVRSISTAVVTVTVPCAPVTLLGLRGQVGNRTRGAAPRTASGACLPRTPEGLCSLRSNRVPTPPYVSWRSMVQLAAWIAASSSRCWRASSSARRWVAATSTVLTNLTSDRE